MTIPVSVRTCPRNPGPQQGAVTVGWDASPWYAMSTTRPARTRPMPIRTVTGREETKVDTRLATDYLYPGAGVETKSALDGPVPRPLIQSLPWPR